MNNGVYRCGFATEQAAYEEAFDRLFARLDALEARLASSRFLMGEQPREVDVRLITTLVRFDAACHGHFTTNRSTLTELPPCGATPASCTPSRAGGARSTSTTSSGTTTARTTRSTRPVSCPPART